MAATKIYKNTSGFCLIVPAEASNMETWIDGVSDGGQVVTPGATITMLNGTTKIVIT